MENARLKGIMADKELEIDDLREIAKGFGEPVAASCPRVGMGMLSREDAMSTPVPPGIEVPDQVETPPGAVAVLRRGTRLVAGARSASCAGP